MSLPTIRIVDVQHNDERVELEDLTQTGLGCLITECKQLLDKLEDAYYAAEEN